MSVPANEIQTVPSNLKRKFDDIEVQDVSKINPSSTCGFLCNPVNINSCNIRQHTDKRQATEGFSWWTCLQLGLPVSSTKPQPRNT
ncbi:hypothetical protein PoB_002972200 [Plakobranchus ocellatus]|uniref:Uncharacterized protein n=1 Tax=Plakobranchus ocellatus TaxID=259542 RepID=A0AAV4A7G2_9GAST|nr:hypothetical protein PoB_002972200 [Plakobranchus ocellatus]